MRDISWSKKIIIIDGEEVTLKYDIMEVHELNDTVLIVTTPEDNILDNLFGISVSTKKVWQVQPLSDIYPEFSQTPYVGVSIVNCDVLVVDFCGCRFIFNPINGKILGKASEVR